MSENVPSTAIRGLGNALKLTGERSAPPGIELGLPGQPIYDLTQFARYGSSPVFEHFSDGWVSCSRDVGHALTTQGVVTVTDWSAVVSGDFGISQNILSSMALWIYDVTMIATAAVAMGDAGGTGIDIAVTTGVDETAVAGRHQIWAANGTPVAFRETLLIGVMQNLVSPNFPIQWAAGADLTLTIRNDVANTVTYAYSLLCRLVPLGVMPPGL